MSNLQYRQDKIQEKHRATTREDFVAGVCSRQPITFSKVADLVSRYPNTNRRLSLVSIREFESKRDSLVNTNNIQFEHDNFFDNLSQLFFTTPQRNLIHYTENENSDYGDCVFSSKNVYLSNTVLLDCENVIYSFDIRYSSSNVLNSFYVYYGENIYQSVMVNKSQNIFFSKGIDGSNNIRFSSNLTGCTECLKCNDIQNQSYCIENKQYSKEEYFTRKKMLLNDIAADYHKITIPQGVYGNHNNIDSQGNGVINSENTTSSIFVNGLKNGRNVILGGSPLGASNQFDCFIAGGGDMYVGCLNSGNNSQQVYVCNNMTTCVSCFYCLDMLNCSFCLGCIGLKNKSYCILNKQYEKEERHEKVDEILGKMEINGVLGDFFPASMNPFYFNDTAAYLIDPSFTKEEVVKLGFLWRDEPIKVDIPVDSQIISSSDLDQFETYDEGNRTINSDILKKVIQDQQGNYYRIIPMEYKFLMKYGLPLPRKHWLERMKDNFRIS